MEKPPRESPPHPPSAPRRLTRQGLEGREREPEFQEPALPPQFVLPMLPVPTTPTAREPMEWDMESRTLTGTAASAASNNAPPPPRPSGERRRKRKKRSRPYNPQQHLEQDDYVLGLPTPPRSPSRPGPPSRPPPSPLAERGERSRSRTSTGSRGSGRGTLPVKSSGIMFGELLPIPADPALDPPPKACYNCWQMGHSCVRCPRPSTVFCHNCGRRGTDLTVCPRCWVTHRAYIQQKYGRDGPRLSTSHRQGQMAAAAPESRAGERRVPNSRAESPVERGGRSREG